MLPTEITVFRAINGLAHKHPALDAIGVFCARWLIVVMFAAVIVRAYLAMRRPETRSLAAALAVVEVRALAAAGLAFFGNWLFSLLFFRARPYVTLKDVHLLVPPPLTPHAFPSGHSSAAFALAFTVLLFDPPFGVAMLAGAFFVALGRVFVGVHFPLDVAMGMFVGMLWAVVLQAVGSRVHDLDIARRWLERKPGRR